MTGIGATLAAFASRRAVPAQAAETTGGSTAAILAVFLLFGVAVVLATLVTYHFVQGYRRTGRRPMLLLAVGMFLLAAAPMFVRLLLGNVDLVTSTTRRFVVACLELCGLLTLLYVVYDS
ncbi:hypothetical protein [Halorientalis marina]|jgi:hypothetical protein|uniref:hypothetical protein n=1 Tax=Halorientalis marina TaxID=2931976 RepID=UPI001FF650C4|nr:hypothetical protein [Halorientalis marina]